MDVSNSNTTLIDSSQTYIIIPVYVVVNIDSNNNIMIYNKFKTILNFHVCK